MDSGWFFTRGGEQFRGQLIHQLERIATALERIEKQMEQKQEG